MEVDLRSEADDMMRLLVKFNRLNAEFGDRAAVLALELKELIDRVDAKHKEMKAT